MDANYMQSDVTNVTQHTNEKINNTANERTKNKEKNIVIAFARAMLQQSKSDNGSKRKTTIIDVDKSRYVKLH